MSIRRSASRAVLAVWAVLFAVLLWDRYATPARLQWELRAAFDVASTFDIPADRLVYDNRPDESRMTDLSYGPLVSIAFFCDVGQTAPESVGVGYRAGGLAYGDLLRRSTQFVTWEKLRSKASGNTVDALPELEPSECCVFLHERSAGNGRRLVAVTFQPRLGLRFRVATPPRWGESVVMRSVRINDPIRADWIVGPLGGMYVSSMRIFGGQCDPSDPSKFTIAYEVAGQRSRMWFRLNDDDSIDITDEGAKDLAPDTNVGEMTEPPPLNEKWHSSTSPSSSPPPPPNPRPL